MKHLIVQMSKKNSLNEQKICSKEQKKSSNEQKKYIQHEPNSSNQQKIVQMSKNKFKWTKR